MRRFVPAAIVASVALAVPAAPASAQIDHHFSVIAKQIRSSVHQTPDNGFRFRERLFSTADHDNQVGNDHVFCHQRHSKVKCRATINLNGEVGGFGSLRVNGNIGPGDHRLNVLGGTGDFSGAAGKVITDGNRLHFTVIG